MRMKVSFSCNQIFLHIGSNFNGTFASFTFLPTIALTAPHSCCYSVIKFIDFVKVRSCLPWKVFISIVISLRVSFSDFLY